MHNIDPSSGNIPPRSIQPQHSPMNHLQTRPSSSPGLIHRPSHHLIHHRQRPPDENTQTMSPTHPLPPPTLRSIVIYTRIKKSYRPARRLGVSIAIQRRVTSRVICSMSVPGADTYETCFVTPNTKWKGKEWLRKDVHVTDTWIIARICIIKWALG